VNKRTPKPQYRHCGHRAGISYGCRQAEIAAQRPQWRDEGRGDKGRKSQPQRKKQLYRPRTARKGRGSRSIQSFKSAPTGHPLCQ